MVAELLLDQRAGRTMELALLVAPVDRLLEAGVAPLRPAVLGRPERDVAGEQDCGVEEHETVDLVRMRRDVLEGEPRAERVAQPGAPPVPERRAEARQVVLDAPRRLARRIAVPEQVRREDPVRPGESRGETGEVPAPRGDPVEADDLRRAVPPHLRTWSDRAVDGLPSVTCGEGSGRAGRPAGGSLTVDPIPALAMPVRAARAILVGASRSASPQGACEAPGVTVSADHGPKRAGFVPAVSPRAGAATPAVVTVAPARAHVSSCSVSSDSGTISVRRVPSSLTSDQITVPSRSMRKVPRIGAPVSSLNTP